MNDPDLPGFLFEDAIISLWPSAPDVGPFDLEDKAYLRIDRQTFWRTRDERLHNLRPWTTHSWYISNITAASLRRLAFVIGENSWRIERTLVAADANANPVYILFFHLDNVTSEKESFIEYLGMMAEAKSRPLSKAEIEHLRTMPYAEYLQTEHWKSLRKSMLRQANNRCQVCNVSNRPLHVHHRTYERRGEERYEDLTVLCADCHKLFHENGKVQS